MDAEERELIEKFGDWISLRKSPVAQGNPG